MADQSPAATLLFLRDEELRHGLELMLAAERHLTLESEALLAGHELATGHGQIILMVARRPQMTVGGALEALRISKQTGSRLVNDLIKAGYLTQRTSPHDRRQRQLSLTEDGRKLDRLLWERQRPRLVRAFRASGPDAVEGFRKVLLAICEPLPERRPAEYPAALRP